MDEADVRTVLAHPTTMIGSDGVPAAGSKPHQRRYGCFPRVLGHYVRDQGALDLPTAIHRMTGMPAAKFRLADRGAIRPGAFADLVVFDPLATSATPPNTRRPRRFPEVFAPCTSRTAVARDATKRARPDAPCWRGR